MTKVDVWMDGGPYFAVTIDRDDDPRAMARALLRWAETQMESRMDAEAYVYDESDNITYCVMNHPDQLGASDDYPIEISYVVKTRVEPQLSELDTVLVGEVADRLASEHPSLTPDEVANLIRGAAMKYALYA